MISRSNCELIATAAVIAKLKHTVHFIGCNSRASNMQVKLPETKGVMGVTVCALSPNPKPYTSNPKPYILHPEISYSKQKQLQTYRYCSSYR